MQCSYRRAAPVAAWLAIVVALLISWANHAPAADSPNIVFILADDVGVEPLGCYGGESFATPKIDELAAGGMRFQHCYSMPVCHPTRICLLTGRYPRHVGNPAWGSFPPRLEARTLAHVMKRAGYAAAVAGKWQLATLGQDPEHPRRLGFDEYCLFGWHEGARYHDPFIWQNGARRTDALGRFGPDLYVDFLVDFMTRHREQPFFAFYSMALCHDVTDDLAQPVPYAPGKDRYLNYGEMVAAMDACVGRIVAAVDGLGLRERTLIVFTGDNGTAKRSIVRAEPSGNDRKPWSYLREPVVCQVDGRPIPGGKGELNDRGTHVPLLARWPGRIEPGQIVDDLVDFSDFLPTFADLAGGGAPTDMELDGRSFAARLRDDEPSGRTWAYAEAGPRFWVRTQRWKLTHGGEFFDVHKDPEETRDLSTTQLSPSVSRIKQQLQQALEQL